MLFDNLTRAILRIAELGFLGVITVTERHTPLFCGAPRRNILEREVNALWTVASARDLPLRFERERFRGFRTSWFRVGNLMALYGFRCWSNGYACMHSRSRSLSFKRYLNR